MSRAVNSVWTGKAQRAMAHPPICPSVQRTLPERSHSAHHADLLLPPVSCWPGGQGALNGSHTE